MKLLNPLELHLKVANLYMAIIAMNRAKNKLKT